MSPPPGEPDSSGWSAASYNANAPFVYSAAFTAPVLDLLAPKPGERIMDFGCGSGEVTLQIEEVVQANGAGGLVVGVDLSESMVSRFIILSAEEQCLTRDLIDRPSQVQRCKTGFCC